jgi:hypothetical protein
MQYDSRKTIRHLKSGGDRERLGHTSGKKRVRFQITRPFRIMNSYNHTSQKHIPRGTEQPNNTVGFLRRDYSRFKLH